MDDENTPINLRHDIDRNADDLEQQEKDIKALKKRLDALEKRADSAEKALRDAGMAFEIILRHYDRRGPSNEEVASAIGEFQRIRDRLKKFRE